MPETAIEQKMISDFGDLPDLLPISREGFQPWNIHIIPRAPQTCKNYLSPNRRDFYKIMYVTKGIGVFTLGSHTYHIEEPTILFIHPGEIISWKKLNKESEGYIGFFKKKYADRYPGLKALIEKYGMFTDVQKSVIRLTQSDVAVLDSLFAQMFEAEKSDDPLSEETMQAYLQLLILNCTRIASYAEPNAISGDFKHLHEFFHLLEEEAGKINYVNPIRLKTATAFADELSLHPNYLNALLKKHTGQNVSAHIKGRLLEQSKVLLLQTDWSLQDIAYSVGFADQSNFSHFFKKQSGISPADFKKNHIL
jgi:AraC family transcriptional regulator, transcriptional activator of pobA